MNKLHSPFQVQEKGKISSRQLAFLTVTLVIATADVFLPAFVAQEAGRDAWIAVIIGTVFSLVIVNLFLILGLRYPDKTIIQYSCDILGKPLGKFVGLILVYYYVLVGWSVTRELGELFLTAFNPESPIIVYSLLIIVVAAYAAGQGVEVIARVNEILLPAGLGILIFIAVTNLPQSDFKNFLPIMYGGIVPPIRGGILVLGWLVQPVVFLQILPFVSDKKTVRRNMNISVIVLGLALELGVLTIAVFGPLTAKLLFPALEYVRFASLGYYIQNLDIIIMVVWVGGIFIKIVVFYYAAVLGISQLFGLKESKALISPVGALIICFSMSTAKTLGELMHALHYVSPLFSSAMALVVPGILLAVSLIRGGGKKAKTT